MESQYPVEVGMVVNLLQNRLEGRIAVNIFHGAAGTNADESICRHDSFLSRRLVAANQLHRRVEGGLRKLVCVVRISPMRTSSRSFASDVTPFITARMST